MKTAIGKGKESNLCDDFGTDYDAKDSTCKRCHCQMACLEDVRLIHNPKKAQEFLDKMGAKYFLDEVREDQFEEFYLEIVELIKDGTITNDEKLIEVVKKNQEDWLQIADPEFGNIVLARTKREGLCYSL